jgi:hypothetical protein
MSETILRDRSARQNVPVPYRAAEGLRINSLTKGVGGSRTYHIRARSGEPCQLGEEEYFIFTLLDGRPTFGDIEREFRTRFAGTLSRPQFQILMDELLAAGVIERVADDVSAEDDDLEVAPPTVIPSSVAPSSVASSSVAPRTGLRRIPERAERAEVREPLEPPLTARAQHDGASLLPLFMLLARLSSPLRFFAWLFIPASAVAGAMLYMNEGQVIRTLTGLAWTAPSVILTVLGAVLTTWLAPRLAEGTAAAFHGAPPETFRFHLTAGVLPRFPVDRRQIATLPRKARVWSNAAALLTRLAMFILGMAFWGLYAASSTRFAVAALLFGEVGLWSFLLSIIPILPGAGKRWFEAYFDEPGVGGHLEDADA